MRFFAYSLAGLGLAVLGFVAMRWATQPPYAGPALVYSPVLTQPDSEQGQTVTVTIPLGNRGRQELVIDQFRMDCACEDLGQWVGNQLQRVQALHLPGQTAQELVWRFEVPRQAIAPFHKSVHFRTNDPLNPFATVTAHFPQLRGGLTVTPTQLLFGTLPQGAEGPLTLDLLDGGTIPRRLERIEISHPEQIHVEELPATAPALARLRVRLNTVRVASIDGEIRLLVGGTGKTSHIAVPIQGRVVAPIELLPSSATLPRRSSTGWLYSGQFLCRGWSADPLQVEAVTVPPGLHLEWLPATTTNARSFKLTWKPTTEDQPTLTQIGLRATQGPQTALLTLPVRLTPVQDDSP
jgi:hypothetical protein